MTATEFLRFHSSFKPLLENIEIKEILEIIGLTNAANKQIRYYSSGMKQRIKLAQAVFANVPVLLLDEPCTNFDSAGYELYYRLITDYCINKIIIVSSNDTNEFNFCKERISMLDFR
jgi:ABC-type multidrug transport system ATPase subunit